MTGKAQIKNNVISRMNNNNIRINTNFNATRNVNKLSPSIPITGSGVNGSMNSHLIMNTFDIVDVDKIIFGTTAGSGSALSSTDTGIGTNYVSGVSFGMKVQIPATANNEIFQLYRGTNEIINISPAGTIIYGNIFLGTSNTNTLTISSKVGFYSATPIAKPTITGSKGGNAALTSLLSALSSFGLITNSTT